MSADEAVSSRSSSASRTAGVDFRHMLLGAGEGAAEVCAELAAALGAMELLTGALVVYRDPATFRFGIAGWPGVTAAPESRDLRRFVATLATRAAGEPLDPAWAATLGVEAETSAAVFPVRFADVTAGALVLAGGGAEDGSMYRRVAALLGWELVGTEAPETGERAEDRRLLLGEIAALLNRQEPIEGILDRVLELTGRAIAFDYIEFAERLSPKVYALLFSSPQTDPVTLNSTATDADLDLFRAAGLRIAQYRPAELLETGAAAFARRGRQRAMTGIVEHGGEALGLVTLAKDANAPFDDGEVAFFEVLCNLLGAAVGQRRLLERAARAAERDRLLNELGLLLGAGESVERLIEAALGTLKQVIAFDYFFVSARERESGPLVVQFIRPELLRRGDVTRVSDAEMAQIAATGRKCVQYRSDRVGGSSNTRALEWGFVRLCVALLLRDNEPMGILTLGRRENVPYTAEEEQFLETVASFLAQALTNRRRLQESDQATARSKALNELSLLLNAGEPVETLFERLQELVGTAVGFDYCGLGIRRGDSGMFAIRRSGTATAREETEEVFLAGVVAAGPEGLRAVQFLTSEMFHLPSAELLFSAGFKRIATVAMEADGRVIGRLAIGRREDIPLDAREMEFVETAGAMLEQAATQQLRLEATRREAATSSLLKELALQLKAGDPVTTVFDSVEPLVREAVGADIVYVLGPGAEPNTFRTIGMSKDSGRKPRARMGWADVNVDELAAAPVAVVTYDPASVDHLGRRLAEYGFGLAGSMLLRDGDRIIGLLTVARVKAAAFDARDTTTIEAVGVLFARALAAEGRMSRTIEEAEEQRLLAEVAAAIAHENDPAAVATALETVLKQVIPEPVVVFGFLEGEEVVYEDIRVETYRSGLTQYHVLTERLGQVNGRWPSEELGRENPLSLLGLKETAYTVARAGGNTVGYLLTGSLREGFVFSESNLELIRIIAQLIGPAMANARVSKRTAAERAVYDLALSSLDEAVILLDHDLRVAFCNEAGAPLIAANLGAGESVATAAERFDASVQVALREAMAGRRAWAVGSARIHGEERTYDFDVAPLSHPDYRLLVVGRDVTERVRREEEEQRHRAEIGEAARETAAQRELLELVVQSMTAGVILLDEGFVTRFANAPGNRILELLDPERHGARTLEENLRLLPEEMRGDFIAAVVEGRRTSGRTSREVAGETRHFDYELIPLENRPMLLLAVTNEVTEEVGRERAEESHRAQLEQATRLSALGELVGGVAHELNNPLSAILGFAEILSADAAGGAQPVELEIIRKEALRARDVVRDLLFLARPGTVERTEVLLSEVVGHIERVRRSQWMRQGIEVRVDTTAEARPAWGNEHQLTQVLLNLVSNAEAAVEGVENARIELIVRSDADGALIEVRDNGRGMNRATRERIFEPFFTTRQGVGTGLGLSLSHSIVAAHGGRIEVESTPGAGTAFRIIVPPGGMAARGAQDASAVAKTRLNVLVIDDEPSLRIVCQRMLAMLGHDSVTADSPAAAAALAEAGDYDLVLCDFRLGAETAEAVIEAFVARAPHLVERTTIVTGAATDEAVRHLTERYGLRILAKPYGAEQLRGELAVAAERLAKR